MDLFMEQILLLKRKKEELIIKKSKLLSEKENIIKKENTLIYEKRVLNDDIWKMDCLKRAIKYKKRYKKDMLILNIVFILIIYILTQLLSSSLFNIVLFVGVLTLGKMNFEFLKNLIKSNRIIKDSYGPKDLVEIDILSEKMFEDIEIKRNFINQKKKELEKINALLEKIENDVIIIDEKISFFEGKRFIALEQMPLKNLALENEVNALFEEQGLKLERVLDKEEI